MGPSQILRALHEPRIAVILLTHGAVRRTVQVDGREELIGCQRHIVNQRVKRVRAWRIRRASRSRRIKLGEEALVDRVHRDAAAARLPLHDRPVVKLRERRCGNEPLLTPSNIG